LGLDGVRDTNSLLESEPRERHVRWLTNAKVEARQITRTYGMCL
jgi:sulfide:quinone oxidoreductase